MEVPESSDGPPAPANYEKNLRHRCMLCESQNVVLFSMYFPESVGEVILLAVARKLTAS